MKTIIKSKGKKGGILLDFDEVAAIYVRGKDKEDGTLCVHIAFRAKGEPVFLNMSEERYFSLMDELSKIADKAICL
jgi:hypothetical protein